MLIEKQLGQLDSYLIREQCQESVPEANEKLSLQCILLKFHYSFQIFPSQILKVTWLRRSLESLARIFN